MLAVDAELPMHTVLSVILSEQHPQPHYQRAAQRHLGPQAAGDAPDLRNARPNSTGDDGANMQLRREGAGEEPPAPLGCGIVSPSLPNNVLAEVCEFDPCPSEPSRPVESQTPPVPEDTGEDKTPAVRRWTSPDDGWGVQMCTSLQQDLEKMPMGMPVTVGEVADFLVHACESSVAKESPTENSSESSVQRWATPASASCSCGGSSTQGAEDAKSNSCQAAASDMLDWSLAQWRAHRLKMSGEKVPQTGSTPVQDSEPPLSEPVEPSSRLFVEEQTRGVRVDVHRVPLAPPRPILCTDDPEASLLKAVQLLLAYPELDALPVVNIMRCTVVAHLTLAACLAYILSRLRGADLMPLASVVVTARPSPEGELAQRAFDSRSCIDAAQGDCWAERRTPSVRQSPWVLGRKQTIRELLCFFVHTHHSGVPVVEDPCSTGAGVFGLVSRRDLLQYLDLAMQSARRCDNEGGQAEDAEKVCFDVAAPVEVVLETLRRFSNPSSDGNPATNEPAAEPEPTVSDNDNKASFGFGASFVYEKELTLKVLVLRVLGAENRKVLFVEDSGNGCAPKLLRMISVSDVWLMLIGEEPEVVMEAANDGTSAQDV